MKTLNVLFSATEFPLSIEEYDAQFSPRSRECTVLFNVLSPDILNRSIGYNKNSSSGSSSEATFL